MGSRTDLIWQADHPPLAMLDSGAVWIPRTVRHSADGASGLCDWHAAVPRSFADAYFDRWSQFAQGTAPATPNNNPHVFLRSSLRVQGVPVGRFPSVAGLMNCDGR